MVNKKMVIFTVIFMLVLLSGLSALHASIGDAGADFLALEVSPRTSAMGGAGVALPYGGVFNNPAAISSEPRNVSLSYQQGVGDLDNYAAGYTHPYMRGMLGVGTRYLGIDDEERGEPTAGGDPNFGSSFTNSSFSMGGYYAETSGSLSWGGGLNIINDELHDESATAFAVDAGVQYELPVYPARVGATVKNLGTGLEYIDETEDLPLEIRIGGALRVSELMEIQQPLVVVMDFYRNQPEGWNGYSLGAEYLVGHGLSLRAGYRDIMGEDLDSSLSFGFGFQFDQISVDYAYQSGDELDDNSRVSVSYYFGSPSEEQPSLRAERDLAQVRQAPEPKPEPEPEPVPEPEPEPEPEKEIAIDMVYEEDTMPIETDDESEPEIELETSVDTADIEDTPSAPEQTLPSLFGSKPEEEIDTEELYSRGIAAYNEGDYEEAHESLLKVYEEDPTDIDNLNWLGVTEVALGKNSAALERFEKVLQSDPDNEYARRAIEHLKNR